MVLEDEKQVTPVRWYEKVWAYIKWIISFKGDNFSRNFAQIYLNIFAAQAESSIVEFSEVFL